MDIRANDEPQRRRLFARARILALLVILTAAPLLARPVAGSAALPEPAAAPTIDA